MSNSTKTSKTFNCETCGIECPVRRGKNIYCLECGIKKNRLESEYFKTLIRREKREIELEEIKQKKVDVKRKSFLAELEAEGMDTRTYDLKLQREAEIDNQFYNTHVV